MGRLRRLSIGGIVADPRFQTGTSLLGSAFDAIGKENQFGNKPTGVKVGSGILQGASMGASFGPYGAAAGAILGGAYGLIDGNNQRKKEQQMLYEQELQDKTNAKKSTSELFKTNPELFKGNLSSGYYALGGEANGFGKTIGGSIKELTDEDSFVQGRSHDSGGVKIPATKEELEGGETMNQDFVFSKRLGFADKHLKLVEEKMKYEKVLEGNPLSKEAKNALNLTERKIQNLKVEQEELKARLGIPNELEKANGGQSNIFNLAEFSKRDYTLPDVKVEDVTVNYASNPEVNEDKPNLSFDGVSSGGGSVAMSHNNPRNVKFANWMTQFGATKGRAGKDGGVFAKFPTIEAGLEASKHLLTKRGIYNNLSVNDALKKWSNNGYDGRIVPSLSGKKINQLSDDELNVLMKEQIRHEDGKMYSKLYGKKETGGYVEFGGGGSRLGKVLRKVTDVVQNGEKHLTKGAIATSPYFMANSKPKKGTQDDSLLEDMVEIVDPTGISSYDDVYREGKNYFSNYKNMSTKDKLIGAGSLGLEVMGALPVIGKLGKGIKGLKSVANMTRATSKFDRIMDAYSALNIATNWDSYAMGGYVKFEDGGQKSSKTEAFAKANAVEIKEYENMLANRKAGYKFNGKEAVRFSDLKARFGQHVSRRDSKLTNQILADDKEYAKNQEIKKRKEINKFAKEGRKKYNEAGKPRVYEPLDGRTVNGQNRKTINSMRKENDPSLISQQRIQRKLEENRQKLANQKLAEQKQSVPEKKILTPSSDRPDFEKQQSFDARQEEAIKKGMLAKGDKIDADFEERQRKFKEAKDARTKQVEKQKYFDDIEAERKARVDEFGRLRESKNAGNVFHGKSKLANVGNFLYHNYDKVLAAGAVGYGAYRKFFNGDKENKLPVQGNVANGKPAPKSPFAPLNPLAPKPTAKKEPFSLIPEKQSQATEKPQVVKGSDIVGQTAPYVAGKGTGSKGKGVGSDKQADFQPVSSASLNTQNKANLYDKVTGQGSFAVKFNAPKLNPSAENMLAGMKRFTGNANLGGSYKEEPTKSKNKVDVLDGLSLVGDNVIGALRRYPDVPNPVLQSEVRLQAPNLSASYARNNQDFSNALTGIGNMGLGQQAAVRNQLLASKLKANNELAQTENNARIQNANREAEINSNIRANNNALTNQFNSDRAERSLAIGDARQAYIGDTLSKLQLRNNDDKRQSMDMAKTYLSLLGTDNGVRKSIIGDTGLTDVMEAGKQALISNFGRGKKKYGGKMKNAC